MSLDDFSGSWLVVYFYPRDNTPGCTREAADFAKALPAFKKLGADVVGVSKDSIASHQAFRAKYKLPFRLLSDPDLVAHEAFGAWGEKNMYGKKTQGTIRSTFLVSPKGKILRVWSPVRVDGHCQSVLEALRESRA